MHYSTLHTGPGFAPLVECKNIMDIDVKGCKFDTTYCLGAWAGGDLLAFVLANPLVDVMTTLPSVAAF